MRGIGPVFSVRKPDVFRTWRMTVEKVSWTSLSNEASEIKARLRALQLLFAGYKQEATYEFQDEAFWGLSEIVGSIADRAENLAEKLDNPRLDKVLAEAK